MIGKTINSERVWQSADGKRTIWSVLLQAPDGKNYRLKTYSPAVSRMGYEGDIESYEAKNGERFVRQVPKAPVGTPSGDARDDNIRAQWAIGQAINLASATMEKDKIDLSVIESYAKDLFATVSRVKGETFSPDMRERAHNYISRNLPQTANA
jgi:hypothetical protein